MTRGPQPLQPAGVPLEYLAPSQPAPPRHTPAIGQLRGRPAPPRRLPASRFGPREASLRAWQGPPERQAEVIDDDPYVADPLPPFREVRRGPRGATDYYTVPYFWDVPTPLALDALRAELDPWSTLLVRRLLIGRTCHFCDCLRAPHGLGLEGDRISHDDPDYIYDVFDVTDPIPAGDFRVLEWPGYILKLVDVCTLNHLVDTPAIIRVADHCSFVVPPQSDSIPQHLMLAARSAWRPPMTEEIMLAATAAHHIFVNLDLGVAPGVVVPTEGFYIVRDLAHKNRVTLFVFTFALEDPPPDGADVEEWDWAMLPDRGPIPVTRAWFGRRGWW